MWMLSGLWIALLLAGSVGLIAGYAIRRNCAQERVRLVLPSSGLPLLPAPVREAGAAEELLAAREADIRRLQDWLESEQDQRLDAEKRVVEWMEAAADAERQRARLMEERAGLDAQLASAWFHREDTEDARRRMARLQEDHDRFYQEAQTLRHDCEKLSEEREAAEAARQGLAERVASLEQAAATHVERLQAASQALVQSQSEVRQMRQQVLALKEEHALQASRRTREMATLAERLREAEAQGRSSASDELGLRSQLEDLLVRHQALHAELAATRAQAEAALQALAELERPPQTLVSTEATAGGAAGDALSERERALQAEVLELRARLEVASAAVPKAEAAHALDADAAGLLAMGQLERLVLAAGEGRRPQADPGDGPGDDLRRIDGIGPANERWLHGIGVRHYAQIAAWTPEEIAWVARHLPRFGQRVCRENWVGQSAALARQGRMVEPQAVHATA